MVKSVLERIQSCEAELSPKQRHVAEIIRSMPNEAALFTIQEFGEKAGVSDATVLRFARTLGYSGYPELKDALQRVLIEHVTSWKRVEHTLAEYSEHSSVIEEFVGKQIEFLESMVTTLSDEHLREIAKVIAKSDTVWLHGEGSAATPCHALHFWLGRFGRTPRIILQSGRRLLDEAIRATSSDTAILFSFGLPTKDASVLMEWMTEHEVTTILITDNSETRLSISAKHVLRIERGPMGAFHSMAVPVAISDAIILSVARELGSSAVDAIRLLDNARTLYNL